MLHIFSKNEELIVSLIMVIFYIILFFILKEFIDTFIFYKLVKLYFFFKYLISLNLNILGVYESMYKTSEAKVRKLFNDFYSFYEYRLNLISNFALIKKFMICFLKSLLLLCNAVIKLTLFSALESINLLNKLILLSGRKYAPTTNRRCI